MSEPAELLSAHEHRWATSVSLAPPRHVELEPLPCLDQPRQVLVVTRDALFRQQLATLLAADRRLSVLAQTGSINEARPLLVGADLAVIESRLAGGDGIELLYELRRVNREAIVLLLAGAGGHEPSCAGADVRAVLPRTTTAEEIAAGLGWLAQGHPLRTPVDFADALRADRQRREVDRAARQLLSLLTPREWEILRALAQGLDDQSISEQLRISPNTVRAHMVSLREKLGVESRLQALVFAVRHRAVEIR